MSHLIQEKIAVPEGYIIDIISRQERRETPEEAVRQHFARYLKEELNYLREDMEIEYRIDRGSGSERIDIAIFYHDEKHIQENICIIIETKAPNIKSSNKKSGIGQLKSYLSHCLNSKYGVWTNGIERYCYVKSETHGLRDFIEISEIPSYGKTLDEVEENLGKITRKAVGKSLLYTFKRCHNYIYGNQGISKSKAFQEFSKIILAKIHDERNGYQLFRATSNERNTNKGKKIISDRIQALFSELIKTSEYERIFKPTDKIELNDNVLSYLVTQLQPYSLLKTSTHVKGMAYEEIVGANLRGDRGEFFTPRNMVEFCIKFLEPQPYEKIIDPACGTGGFIVTALNEALEKYDSKLTIENIDLPYHEIYKQKEEIKKSIYGIDFNPDLVLVSKLNMAMNNDGKGNIYSSNSLVSPTLWPEELKKMYGKFDLVITNPPFGTKIPIDDVDILEQYDLAHMWDEDETGNLIMTDRLQKSVPPEILFIERCLQLLKSDGKLGIVVPQGILSNPATKYVRKWIHQHSKILGSITLPPEAFQPHTGTQTSLLFLQKRKVDPKIEYTIFMAVAEEVGHDKRGNPIYIKDPSGKEIIFDGSKIINDDLTTILEEYIKQKEDFI